MGRLPIRTSALLDGSPFYNQGPHRHWAISPAWLRGRPGGKGHTGCVIWKGPGSEGLQWVRALVSRPEERGYGEVCIHELWGWPAEPDQPGIISVLSYPHHPPCLKSCYPPHPLIYQTVSAGHLSLLCWGEGKETGRPR